MLVSGTLSAPQGQVEGLSVYNAVDGQRVLVMSRFLSSISDRRSKKIYKQESAVRGMIFKHISETFAILATLGKNCPKLHIRFLFVSLISKVLTHLEQLSYDLTCFCIFILLYFSCHVWYVMLKIPVEVDTCGSVCCCLKL